MSYTDEQIDAMLKKKQDTDCGYNVCEMNQILSNKVGLDTFNLLKKSVDDGVSKIETELADEAKTRKENDGLIENTVSGIDVRVASLENQRGIGQNVIVSVEKISDLDALTPYDGRSAYVKELGIYRYSDTQKKWIQDKLFDLAPEKFSTNYVASNGGYPKSARIVLNDGVTTVISLVDSNTVDPNQDMTNWAKLTDVDSKESLTYADSVDSLSKLKAFDGKTVYVRDTGLYVYNSNSGKWEIKTSLDLSAKHLLATISDLKNYNNPN